MNYKKFYTNYIHLKYEFILNNKKISSFFSLNKKNNYIG